jgi:CBS domain-containing protein
MRPNEATKNPIQHAAHIERMLRDVRQHLDEDLTRVDDERACVLFDTARQVLDGLVTSFEDYARSAAGLWRDGMSEPAGGAPLARNQQEGGVDMTIKEMMTGNVIVIAPDAPLTEAADKMARRGVGFLPVCDGDRIVGTITDRDITVRAVAAGLDASQTAVSDVMTSDIAYCYEDDQVEKTARLMKERQIRRVIVVDRNKRLVGVVALGDLAREQADRSGDVLEAVSEAAPNS